MTEQRCDIHHIFPKNYLMENGIKEKFNKITNFASAQSEVNKKRYTDMAPRVYMDIVRKQYEDKVPVIGGIIDSGELGKNLEENYIPADLLNIRIEYLPFLSQSQNISDCLVIFGDCTGL